IRVDVSRWIAGQAEQLIDKLLSLVDVVGVEKCPGLCDGRSGADGIEIGSSQKRRVVAHGRRGQAKLPKLRGHKLVDKVVFRPASEVRSGSQWRDHLHDGGAPL